MNEPRQEAPQQQEKDESQKGRDEQEEPLLPRTFLRGPSHHAETSISPCRQSSSGKVSPGSGP